MRKDDMVSVLSDLVALDFDAIVAYESAIGRLADGTAREELSRFKTDHERHVSDLTPHIALLGGEAPTSGDFRRFFAKGKVFLGSSAGDAGVLRAILSNVDRTNRKYEEAVTLAARSRQSEKLLEDLRRNLEDERRHRAWIANRLATMRAAAAA